MTTGLYTHADCLRHDTGEGHPECVARLEVILKALEAPEFAALARIEAPRAALEQIARIHPPHHIEQVLDSVPFSGQAYLDPDTPVSSGSGDAALRAAGAVCAAVDAVVAGKLDNAFCAIRPPGHHAEPDRAMGFCLFNNVAIGAMQARAAHGLERIAVVDFDVHHGNGTQTAFWSDPAAFYGSTHQMPLYPGSGAADEQGCGNIFNVPLAPFAGSAEFRCGMADKILKPLDLFAPDMVFISAGFDAHAGDPLAQLQLIDDDYDWVTGEIMQVAAKHCAGRVVSVLEGGYNLGVLGGSVAAHVRALMSGGAKG
jgi:acetoin utilization deacetylase AcuC-like enzyme